MPEVGQEVGTVDDYTYTARVKFSRNPMMSQATLTTDEEGSRPFFVFCSIPGGTPWCTNDPALPTMIPCRNAPACDTDREFRDFVWERFGPFGVELRVKDDHTVEVAR